MFVNTCTLVGGEHVWIHDFVTGRDPEVWDIRTPFSNVVRRQVPVNEARFNHYFEISYNRRDTSWGAKYHCDVRDDSILGAFA